MLDVISEWRWYQAVLLLRITCFKRQGLKAVQANAAHTQLYKHLMESSVHAYKPLCKDTGHFTLVQCCNHHLPPKIFKVSHEVKAKANSD